MGIPKREKKESITKKVLEEVMTEMFKEELALIINNLFQKVQGKEIHPSLFLDINITQISKSDNSPIKENDISIFLMNTDKNNSLKI